MSSGDEVETNFDYENLNILLQHSTMRFMDLDILNFLMVVWFEARTNFY